METPVEQEPSPTPESHQDFKRFATKRMAVVVALALAALWVIVAVAGRFSGHPELPTTVAHSDSAAPEHGAGADALEAAGGHGATAEPEHAAAADRGISPAQAEPGAHLEGGSAPVAGSHSPAHPEPSVHSEAGSPPAVHSPAPAPSSHAAAPSSAAESAPAHATSSEHAAASAAGHGAPRPVPQIPGVTFVDAVIRPMQHELYDRFWGWRPNDILDFTDNVNNYQLGVLEVTRRTAVTMAERISRAGSTESFDKNLENAMNWFMVSADKYWFPSPEGKYKDGLEEMAAYRDRLKRGSARFWTRTDNLIPLLMAYEDLLGSCDENLVKAKEDDGSEVSFFAADDYFFYAKGVASALHEILAAVEQDFYATIEARRGIEVLHHAIESCHHAMEIDPIVITNANLSGILANHRANMAAPISHARFYLGVLIETLST